MSYLYALILKFVKQYISYGKKVKINTTKRTN